MPALISTALGAVLLIWVGVLVLLVAGLALANRRPRDDAAPDIRVERRAPAGDRRAGRDRRVGLPDLRGERVERRAGTVDRRTGMGDRRRALGRV